MENNLEVKLENLFTYMMKSDDNGNYYIPTVILNNVNDELLLTSANKILEMLNNNTIISIDMEISDAIKLL